MTNLSKGFVKKKKKKKLFQNSINRSIFQHNEKVRFEYNQKS